MLPTCPQHRTVGIPTVPTQPLTTGPSGVNCCPICLTNRDNRCSCRPNPACAGCPWFPLPLRRRS